MNISCPHCGTEYDAEENEYGRYVKCEICGKGFVAGASRPKKNAVRGGTDNVNANIERKRARTPFVVDVGGTRSRRINIYGYREWFIGRRPVRVFVGFSETPICTVPPDVVVSIMVNVNDTLVFKWDGQLGLFQRECRIVVGDCRNVVLSFGNRKDWPLCATATEDVASVLNPIMRSNAHIKTFGLLGIALFIVLAILVICMPTSGQSITGWWWKGGVIGLVFVLQNSKYWRNRLVRAITWSVVAVIATVAMIGVLAPHKATMPSRGQTTDTGEEIQEYRHVAHSSSLSYGSSYSSTSSTSGYSTQMSAKEAIEGALENVKNRYRRNLDRFNLVESLFYDRDDLCELTLVEPIGNGPLYTIRYWKASNQLEWTRLMTKDLAEQFLHDRMLMDTYRKVLSSGR